MFAATIIKQFKFFVKFLRISSWWPRSRTKLSAKSFLEGLPTWAQPERADEPLDDADEASMAEERRKRDVDFWDKAREIHMDAFFQLSGRQVADEQAQRLAEERADTSPDRGAERQWIQTTKTLPPIGNRVAAQVLGFKLRFYSSEARSAGDVLPANLIYLACSPNQDRIHLPPATYTPTCGRLTTRWKDPREEEGGAEGEGEEEPARRRRECPHDGRGTTRRHALGTKLAAEARCDGQQAGPESDRGGCRCRCRRAKAARASRPKGSAPRAPAHHRRASRVALHDRPGHPCLPELYSDQLLPLIHRILLQSVSKVASESQPRPTFQTDCIPKRMADADQSGLPKGSVRLSELPVKRPLRWPFPDRQDVTDGSSYRFYFDEWIDNVPVCQTVDDIFTLCSTLLNISGVNIGRSPELMTSLARIGAKSLAEDRSKQNRDRWQDLLKRLLVPALSLTPTNSSIVDAVWILLKQYPIAVRYNIYAEWNEGATSRLEPITKAFSRTKLETLSTMKRLSLTNISAMARTLAQTAYASPGVVFKVALDQIEAYSNLIQVFVECAKYFTPLGYDVLVWSLLSSLGGKQRSRTQESSCCSRANGSRPCPSSRQRLQALCEHGRVSHPPVRQRPALQGQRDRPGHPQGVHPLHGRLGARHRLHGRANPSHDGRPALRRQTLIGLQDRRFESAKSARRLMQALIDSKLAGRLLINVAQYRQSAIYKPAEAAAHIKYLATMVDDTHQILTQYLDLLRSNLSPEQFDALVRVSAGSWPNSGSARACFHDRARWLELPDGKFQNGVRSLSD